MSISFGMILFGALLIVAGWSNKSLSAVARGDNTVPKGPVLAGGAGAAGGTGPAVPSGPSPAAQGKGGATVGKGGQGSGGAGGGAW